MRMAKPAAALRVLPNLGKGRAEVLIEVSRDLSQGRCEVHGPEDLVQGLPSSSSRQAPIARRAMVSMAARGRPIG